MAQVRGLSASKIQVGSWALLSRIKQPRLALSFAVAGALSFWLPDVVIHIDAGRDFDSPHVWVITILLRTVWRIGWLAGNPDDRCGPSLKHCSRRVYARAREALEVILAD